MRARKRIVHFVRADLVRTLALCVATAPLLLATGCFSQVLRADFNEYAGTPSDSELDGSIPGKPNGDSIQNANDVDVVVDEAIDGKSVRIHGQIELLPESHSVPDAYVINWVGLRALVDNDDTSEIEILDSDGDAALVLEFDGANSELNVMSGSDSVPPISVSNLVHTIQMRVDLRNEGFVDFVYQEVGGPPTELPNLAFLEDFDNLSSINFLGDEDATYYMNDLTVTTETDR